MSRSQHGAPRRYVGAHPLRLVAIALGVIVLAVAGAIWWRAQPAPNVGVATVATLASVSPSPTTDPPLVPVQAGVLPTSAPATVVPVSINIPKLGVSASIVRTGLDSSGNVIIPANIKTVGWYEYGPGLGAPNGSMVIAGHVDSAKLGDGAFFRLRQLDPGDTFTITGTDGKTRKFRVVAREEYPKATIKLGRYFATSGAYRVTLMTCGGSFNASTGHYRDNIAITATPA